ncbi:TonB-dependent receptor [Sphingobacterium sp. DR205]|uniref:TonB-dependent receptor domain-containing protein n=1 Tax=Sphingobacterium sp. DR205 TaxID=2713573 RepID=UPI0013E417CC|nr:TonB-dependent receptor [Sphingobacterium sp. DR205]QIH33425.1 TonB-dependent receptor [Sphingobacterium sp. DR205]
MSDHRLEEVEVVASRPQFVQQIDHIMYNIRGTPIGISGSALEVLQRLPGVEVSPDGTSLAINGRSEIGILMDGKLVRIPISSLLQILSSTNAQDIESIDVFENPPSQFDADFSGGVINIKRIRKRGVGVNGSILLGIGYGDKDKEKVGVNLGYQKDRVNLFGDLNYDRNHTPRNFINSSRQFIGGQQVELYTTTYRDPVITGYTGRIGLDYDLSPKLAMSFIANAYTNRFVQETVGHSLRSIVGDSEISLYSDEDSKRDLFSVNFNTVWKFDSINAFSWDVDYLYYYNEAPIYYSNSYEKDGTLEELNVLKETPVNVLGANFQYSRRFGSNSSLTFGAKFTKSMMTNNVIVDSLKDYVNIRNEMLSEYSEYDESIFAMYGNFDSKLGKNTDLKIGLRYENSKYDLTTKSNNKLNSKTMDELFPTLFINHKMSTNSSAQFSYGRRVNRPTYFDLAPYVLFLDPNTSSFGNINLKSGFSNNLNLSYRYRSYLFGLSYSTEKDAIARSQTVFIEDEEDIVFTSLNIDRLNTWSLNMNIPIKITKWWNMQNNVQLSFLDQKMASMKTSDWFYTARTTQNVSFPYDILGQLFIAYNSERKLGISTLNDFQRVNLSLEKEIKRWNSTFQVSYNTIFGNDFSRESMQGSNYAYLANNLESRVFRFTFIKKFGKNTSKNSTRESSVSDIERRLD